MPLSGSLDSVQHFAKITDWDRAYSNRAAIPNALQIFETMLSEGTDFRRQHGASLDADIPYGDHPRETIDVFHPGGTALGTLVFIHGGYWRSRVKEEHAQFSAGALARGWRVAHPEYPLCPEVDIGRISRDMTKALETIAARFPEGPIVVAGHSAGGHLAAYVASKASGLSDRVRARLTRIVPLSGLPDLRPLLQTTDLNGDLRLDAVQAEALSPALDRPGHLFDLFCVCGGDELPEFRRQNALLGTIWNGFGIAAATLEEPGRNHFTILDGLRHADSDLTRLLTP